MESGERSPTAKLQEQSRVESRESRVSERLELESDAGLQDDGADVVAGAGDDGAEPARVHGVEPRAGEEALDADARVEADRRAAERRAGHALGRTRRHVEDIEADGDEGQ